MLVFMVGIQHRLSATKFRAPLWTGLVLYAVAALVLIFSPADSLGFVLIYVFVAAVAASLVNPRKDALLQLNINPQERARLNALIMASTIALSSPFGYLAGGSPAWTAGCPLCSALCCSWWLCWLSAASKSPLWRRKPP